MGNLLLAALVELQHGDFEEGVREMNRVLAVRGRVVPATGTVITLHARLDDGTEVEGQSLIARTNRVDRVWVEPAGVRPTDDALRAIAEAEVIVIGPGSLFTSLLPALLVPGIREAIAASGALVVYICNVATQPGETGGFDLADHLDALARHGAGDLPDIVLANNRFNALAPAGWLGGAGPAALAARPRRGAAARPGRSRGPGQCPPPLPGPAGGCDHGGLGARGRTPSAAEPRRASSARPEPGRMSESDRDLVAALRAELAAVDPSRPCDRRAEIAGLGPRVTSREPSIARLAVRLGGHAPRGPGRPEPAASSSCPRRPSTGRAPPSTAGSPGCAAGSSPGGR